MEDYNNKQWIRPCDIHTFRTSDPHQMLGKYAAENIARTWTEDFKDEATGETVKVPRSELIHTKGTLLDSDAMQRVLFYLQSGDLKDALVSDQKAFAPQRYDHDASFHLWQVTASSMANKETFLVMAQYMEQAIQITSDYLGTYKGYTDFAPQKAAVISADIIPNDDPCIPEAERKDYEFDQTYYKVSSRVQTYDALEDKMENWDSDWIIQSEDVGMAKTRVARYCRQRYKRRLEGPDNRQNKLTIRKAAPYSVTLVIPCQYSKLYSTFKKKQS